MKKIITVIAIINTKTNEEFKSILDVSEVEKNAKTTKVYTLGREDGTTKEVAESTFKRYYKNTSKQVEIEVEEPKAETKPMTKHQQVAAEQLENAYNWIVGGYENAVTDGDAEKMPSVEELFNEALDEATSHLYGKGMCSQKPAPAAMLFAGRKFVRETLAGLFQTDGYEVPEHLLVVPEKKRLVGPRKNIKGNPESVGKDEVVMRAFTGMLIGVFKIVEQTKKVISIELANGTHMDFDPKTGKELNAPNPRFANRIEVGAC